MALPTGLLLVRAYEPAVSGGDPGEQVSCVEDMDSFPMIAVANRCLRSSAPMLRDEVEALAKYFGCPFVEADMHADFNVEQAFFELVR